MHKKHDKYILEIVTGTLKSPREKHKPVTHIPSGRHLVGRRSFNSTSRPSISRRVWVIEVCFQGDE